MTTRTLRAILIGTLILILTACSAPDTQSDQSAANPAPTTAPTPTNTTAPAAASGLIIAKNTALTQDSGGLIAELRRVVVADKQQMETTLGAKFADASLEPEAFENTDLVGEFILILRNTTDKTLTVYPDQSTVLVHGPNGTRQVDLVWAPIPVAGMDTIGGDIYADVTQIGGIWYPLTPGLTLDDIQTITWHIDAPSDDNYDPIGPDITFEIDLTDRPNDQLTDAVTQP